MDSKISASNRPNPHSCRTIQTLYLVPVLARTLLFRKPQRDDNNNFGNLFVQEYFPNHPDQKKLANALWTKIYVEYSELSNDKTLFILNSLDELS